MSIRIKNISRAKLIFVGGEISPDEEIILKDEEKGRRLLARNPQMLVEVGATKARVIEETAEVEESVEVKDVEASKSNKKPKK